MHSLIFSMKFSTDSFFMLLCLALKGSCLMIKASQGCSSELTEIHKDSFATYMHRLGSHRVRF